MPNTIDSMSSQYLFAYGTLKSTQPEHKAHCIDPLSISRAKVRGNLWKLREGYPILEIDPATAILDASPDAAADWQKALRLAPKVKQGMEPDRWIEGELFEYPLASNSLAKMDEWENFVPGIKSPYQRRVIWVHDEDGNDRIAWAYVCYSPPNWATMLQESHWDSSMA